MEQSTGVGVFDKIDLVLSALERSPLALADLSLTTGIALPRYPTGAGVQMMAVSVAGRTGGQSFNVTYTNQDGVAGRVTPNVIQNLVSVNGSIVTSDRANANARGPFIPLQAGDTGVRSVEEVTMLGADVGLFALVLVKPLADLQIRGVDAPVEVDLAGFPAMVFMLRRAAAL